MLTGGLIRERLGSVSEASIGPLLAVGHIEFAPCEIAFSGVYGPSAFQLQ
jgi:hypothetical protein